MFRAQNQGYGQLVGSQDLIKLQHGCFSVKFEALELQGYVTFVLLCYLDVGFGLNTQER